ncbi:MAG: hypothetical protein ABIJ34_03765 [archaeon]
MKKGITKIKICISLDKELYEELRMQCIKTDAKISTKINTLVSNAIKKGEKRGVE